MDIIPGQQVENQIDETTLLQWIRLAREKAKEADRAVIADIRIGEILASAISDPEDGGWPHRVVRNVVEDLASDNIDEGLMVERYNMRGVYTKAIFEGGLQERELASQYHAWAQISLAKWPRMARVLEHIAKDWEELAMGEDMRAEQEKMG